MGFPSTIEILKKEEIEPVKRGIQLTSVPIVVWGVYVVQLNNSVLWFNSSLNLLEGRCYAYVPNEGGIKFHTENIRRTHPLTFLCGIKLDVVLS